MWRYVFLAVSLAGAATQYPLLFQEKADEIVAMRQNQPGTEEAGKVPASNITMGGNPLAARTVRIEEDGRGHFLVDARLNGRSMRVLVDTGATQVAINESTARRIGLQLTREDFRYRVNTANGEAAAAQAVIDEITIGRVQVRGVRATVLADNALSGVLLGMSFLKQLRRFEIADGSLVLTQ